MPLIKIYKNRIIMRLLYHFRIIELGFKLSATRWHSIHKSPKNPTTKDILNLFYFDFLGVPEKDCEIIKITDKELITRCKNKCPILELSLYLGIDTKKTCKQISEGPCKFFLKKLNKNITFERNYDHIRPYKDDCEEIITISE
jgi:hypothetical protein